MKYLWEVVLAAGNEGIPLNTLNFVHDPNGSGYMELALHYLNQTRVLDTTEIGVNTYYRFYSIFKDLFDPELQEFPDLRESMTNVILHMLAENDVRAGMTKEEYYKKMLRADITEGAFGLETCQVFAMLTRREQERLLSGWLRSYQSGSSLAIFIDMIHSLIDDSIVCHHNDYPNEILIYIGAKENGELRQKIHFLVGLFLEIHYHAEVFYEYHFGMIGMDDTMQIDNIAIY